MLNEEDAVRNIWEEPFENAKGAYGRKDKVKADDGRMLSEEDVARNNIRVETFARLMITKEVKEVEIVVAFRRKQILHVLGELNDLRITKQKVQEVVRDMKARKDGCAIVFGKKMNKRLLLSG